MDIQWTVSVVSTLFLLAASVVSPCSLPSTAEIQTFLYSLLLSQSGEGIEIVVNIHGDPHITCRAVGDHENEFRWLSVAVRYSKNQDPVSSIGQIQLMCSRSSIMPHSLENVVSESVFNLTTRIDCRECSSVENPAVDTEANCYPCTSDCLSLGQGACSDDSGTDCCPFFSSEGHCTNSTVPITSYTSGSVMSTSLSSRFMVTSSTLLTHQTTATSSSSSLSSSSSSSLFIFSAVSTKFPTTSPTIGKIDEGTGALAVAFSAIFGVALVICLLVLVAVWVAYWKLKKVMRNQAKPKMGTVNKLFDSDVVDEFEVKQSPASLPIHEQHEEQSQASLPTHVQLNFLTTQPNYAYRANNTLILDEPVYEDVNEIHSRSICGIVDNPTYASTVHSHY